MNSSLNRTLGRDLIVEEDVVSIFSSLKRVIHSQSLVGIFYPAASSLASRTSDFPTEVQRIVTTTCSSMCSQERRPCKSITFHRMPRTGRHDTNCPGSHHLHADDERYSDYTSILQVGAPPRRREQSRELEGRGSAVTTCFFLVQVWKNAGVTINIERFHAVKGLSSRGELSKVIGQQATLY